jgi:hypothetical protein
MWKRSLFRREAPVHLGVVALADPFYPESLFFHPIQDPVFPSRCSNPTGMRGSQRLRIGRAGLHLELKNLIRDLSAMLGWEGG